MRRLLLPVSYFFFLSFVNAASVDGFISAGEYGESNSTNSIGQVIYAIQNSSALVVGILGVDTYNTRDQPYNDGDFCVLYLDVDNVDNSNKQPTSNSSGALRSPEVCGFTWDFSKTSFRPEVEIVTTNSVFQQSFFNSTTSIWSSPASVVGQTNIDAFRREYAFSWSSYKPRPAWDRFAFAHFCCNGSWTYMQAPAQPSMSSSGYVRNFTDFNYVTSLSASSLFLTSLSFVYPATLAPTTRAPSTGSPTTISPTTISPSSFSPTTRSPSSFSPTHSPSTSSPTNVPTTLSPSFSPTTQSPSTFSPSSLSPTTFAPTSAPTACCLIPITNNGQGGQNITISTPENITIVINTNVLPPNTTGYVNVTTKIFIPPLPGSNTRVVSDIVRVVIIMNNKTHNVTHVDNAISLLVPYKQKFITTCEGKVLVPVCGFFIPEIFSWSTVGCQTKIVSDTTVQCVCSHLTDFAVLLQHSELKRSSDINSNNGCFVPASFSSSAAPVFYTFLAPYFVVFAYCSWCFLNLLSTRAQISNLHSQHAVIACLALTRFLACLFESGAIETNEVALALVVSLPYIFEYWAFSLLAFQWGVLAYSKAFVTSKWVKLWLLLVNVCGGAFTLFVFIAFAFSDSSSKRDFALAGQAVLTLLNALLSVAFLVNSRQLVRLLARAPMSTTVTSSQPRPSSTAEDDPSDKPKPRGRVESRIQTLGIVAPVCFVLQSLMSFLALAVSTTESLIVFTILFFVCDLIALSMLLLVYRSAYLRQLQRSKDRGKSPQKL